MSTYQSQVSFRHLVTAALSPLHTREKGGTPPLEQVQFSETKLGATVRFGRSALRRSFRIELPMGFWERTWQERGEEVRGRFGPTEPPDYVISFSWDTPRLPGACALVFPPVMNTNNARGAWHRRDHWLYLTLGLTQPLDQIQVMDERRAGKQFSSHGFELGILTDEKSDWPTKALYLFLSHITEGLELHWGDRFAFGFRQEADGSLGVFTGLPGELRIEPAGEIRAMLFWPYLFPDANFVTSTGKAMIYIATGITEDEWQLAKATTTAHVLLLLFRAGVGQRTDPERRSVMTDRRWRDEWQRIVTLGGEQAHTELDARHRA